MTLSEFKAWFSGYTEDMGGPPNAKQWKRVKKVVQDIDGTAITEYVYLDRYWTTPWREKWGYGHTGDPLPNWPTVTVTNTKLTGDGGTASALDAMYTAGKAEYALEHSV